MLPYKVKFIETSFSTRHNYAHKYGMLDGHDSAINLEAALKEEYENGYELLEMQPMMSNEAPTKFGYPIPITAGYHLVLKKMNS